MSDALRPNPLFIAILARALADVYEAEPWEVAIAIYGKEGLDMPTELSVRAMKSGLGLSALLNASLIASSTTSCGNDSCSRRDLHT